MSSQAVWAELPFNETSRTDLVQLQAVCLQIAALFQHLEHLGQQWYSMRLTKNSFNSRQVFGSIGCVLYSLCSRLTRLFYQLTRLKHSITLAHLGAGFCVCHERMDL